MPTHPTHSDSMFPTRGLPYSVTCENPTISPFRTMLPGGRGYTLLCANKSKFSWVTAPLSKPPRQLTWSLAIRLGPQGRMPLSLLHSAGGFFDELFPKTQKFRKPPRLLLTLGPQKGLQVSESLNRDSLCILEETEVLLWRLGIPSCL